MEFFKPNNKFIPSIKPYIRHRPVVDCGCGDGHVFDLLLKNGINAIGVDLMNQTERSDIIKGDALNYISKGVLPLVCRPCAGDWYFKVFKLSKVGLFVMKPEHYKRDAVELEAEGHTLTLIEKGVGEDGEWLYYIGDDISDNSEAYNFALVKIPCWDGPWWVEDKGDNYWYNYAGGRTPKGTKDIIYERVTTTGDFESLDWSKTNMIDNSKESGWLSPKGDFYGCDYMEHDRVASLYFHSSSDALMRFGWMRIASKSNWYCYRETTEDQLRWLTEKRYETNRLASASPYNGSKDDGEDSW